MRSETNYLSVCINHFPPPSQQKESQVLLVNLLLASLLHWKTDKKNFIILINLVTQNLSPTPSLGVKLLVSKSAIYLIVNYIG